MSALLAPVIRQRFYDTNGDPLNGGLLYSYLAGTSTPASTYSDSTGLVANANPVVLDANGEANVWLGSGTYKFVLKTSAGVTQWTVDNVTAPGGAAAATSEPWTEHAVTDGQAATALTDITVDFASNSSAIFDVEIIRGTTVIANGHIAVQNLNGTGRVSTGYFMTSEDHGVTFSVTNTSGTIWQLKAALDTGAGNGTIKLYQRGVSA